MAGPLIEVDDSAWPILRIKTHAGTIEAEHVAPYLEAMDRMVARGEVFVTILDNSSMARPGNPRFLRQTQGWVDRHREELERISCGTVIVAKSALMRGVAKFLLHARRLETPGTVVSSMDEAVDWCIARLRQKGVDYDEARATRLRTDDATLTPIELNGEEIDLERQALVELTMSAFAEPAFLVTIDGQLLFENVAATRAFGRPPAWLPHAIDHGNEALKNLCRVVPLNLSGPVAVIVPGEELIPSSEDARPELDLPDGLMRVAELVAQGMSDKEVAQHCELSLSSVRTYVSRIFKRLDVHSRGELIRIWASVDRRTVSG